MWSWLIRMFSFRLVKFVATHWYLIGMYFGKYLYAISSRLGFVSTIIFALFGIKPISNMFKTEEFQKYKEMGTSLYSFGKDFYAKFFSNDDQIKK